MDGGMRSGGPSGVFVKNKNSSGCLIVRKKGDGVASAVGSSSSRSFMDPRKEKRRPSAVMSDSGSSDELLMPSRRRAGPETIRACNGLAPREKAVVEDSRIPRKRKRLKQVSHNEDGLLSMRGYEEREKKRGKLDVFDFDEYDGIDGDHMQRKRPDDGAAGFGERRIKGSMPVDRISNEREYESGPRYRIGGLDLGDSVDRSRLKMKRDGDQVPKPMLREQYMTRLDEAIRVQGKSGVLKVLVKKKKIGGGTPFEHIDLLKPVVSRRTLKTEGSSKRNTHLHPYLQPVIKHVDRPDLIVRAEKSQWVSKKSMSSKESDDNERNSENSDASLKLGSKNIQACKSVNRESYEDEPRLKNSQAHRPTKRVTSEDELTPVQEKLLAGRTNEGKVKRGSGTEKQKLRERIREMLHDAGWTIDYRPRKNRDYLDAVYINPSGTAYWSIIKAYEALQKQLNEDKIELTHSGDVGFSFAPIADDVLSQLTRKTWKKLEKEMKKKRKTESESGKKAHHQHHMEGVDSDSHEEKLNTFMKRVGKACKSKINENGVRRINSRSQNFSIEYKDGTGRPPSESDSHLRHERKNREHSRCALLIRGSSKGLYSEVDDFVPYPGKRTILSWLIDSGMVQLSQKVQYCRRKRVLLEGWVTRDGIHCGCCSKILTVSKFEIHAGSKVRHPFHSIFLESGNSLLQCQIDAWNRQEGSENIRFYSVDVDGDDPNDDTCGICGDGGDLICCDGCPSTFHLSCLDIEKLPPGEWHCPNCSCKFCGLAIGADNQDNEKKMASTLCICNLCEKKYHESCIKDMDTSLTDSDLPHLAFCGKDCKELFEHLKKYLGAKHELDAGFSWSLLHRTDEDSDAAFRGISQRVESNSKLAVGLAVMDECFLPIVDRRSGINLIQNVLYNSGSNFNRLNYKGFYAAVLEKGDEIISIASIRFHGTKLAEMPFIGTRHIYRHQGMCRRLLSALESALCSLKVERLIIPAIAELMHTWTAIFGFTPLEESFKKEMRSMNMLVFPGVDMLQKRMNAQVKLEGKATISGGKQIHLVGCDVVHKLGTNSPSYPDPHGCDDDISQPTNENMDDGAASDSGFQSEGLHRNDASHETGNLVTTDGILNSISGPMLAEYASHRKSTSPRIGLFAVDMQDLVTDFPIKENLCSSPQLQGAPVRDTLIDHPTNSSDEHKDLVLARESACHGTKMLEADFDSKLESPSASKDGSLDTGNNRNYDSQVSVSTGSSDSSHAESSLGLVEALPSSGGFSSTSIEKNVSDELNVSDSAVRGADETGMHVRSDLKAKASEEGTKLPILSEATSFETHCEKAIDKSRGDPGNETL